MTTVDSLKAVERQAYRSTFEDGIYDILCGGVFLFCALIPIVESLGIPRIYGYFSILVLAVIPWIGKRYITIPRLGAVEYGERRKSRRRYTVLIGIGVVVLMLPLLIGMFARGIPEDGTWSTVALVAAPLIAVAVILLDYPRIYVYASLLLFSVVAAEYCLDYIDQPLNSLVAFGIPGAAIGGYGFTLLFRFLVKYPKPVEEISRVSR